MPLFRKLLGVPKAASVGKKRFVGISLSSVVSVQYLVVGGGGGGGGYIGGGGGAGGFRTASDFSVSSGSPITVTVGAGGASGTSQTTSSDATAGANSVFSTIISDGGGFGANAYGQNGDLRNGGNGGSGIVIVRYLTSLTSSYTVTGGTSATTGSYTYRTFTGDGSLVISAP